jgi:glycosylphosphatidylinositol transamidase (GPIT) subunit GPI8
MMMKYLAVGDVDSAICILSAAGEHDLAYAVIDSFIYFCVTYIKTMNGR